MFRRSVTSIAYIIPETDGMSNFGAFVPSTLSATPNVFSLLVSGEYTHLSMACIKSGLVGVQLLKEY